MKSNYNQRKISFQMNLILRSSVKIGLNSRTLLRYIEFRLYSNIIDSVAIWFESKQALNSTYQVLRGHRYRQRYLLFLDTISDHEPMIGVYPAAWVPCRKIFKFLDSEQTMGHYLWPMTHVTHWTSDPWPIDSWPIDPSWIFGHLSSTI